MTDFRAHVERAYRAGFFETLQLLISNSVRDIGGSYSNVVKELAGPNGTILERVEENTIIPFYVYMSEDVAKALMLGLLEYFGEYKGDVRILRQDYMAERKRVDKFIDHMIGGSSDISR